MATKKIYELNNKFYYPKDLYTELKIVPQEIYYDENEDENNYKEEIKEIIDEFYELHKKEFSE